MLYPAVGTMKTVEGHNVSDIEQESGEVISEESTAEIAGGIEITLQTPTLEDNGHPLIPEVKKDYIAREIYGNWDLELLSFVMNDPDYFAMLEGEASVGKNISIDTLCAACNWPNIRVNFGSNTSYKSLVGRYAPTSGADKDNIKHILIALSTAESAKERQEIVRNNNLKQRSDFEWIDGVLTKAVKYGWVFVADEINSAHSDAIMPLNGLTESKGNRYLTIAEKGEVIEPHPRFRFLATRNPIGYAGVSDMNSALESRAYVIQYDYHEAKALKEILRNETDIYENAHSTAVNNLIHMIDNIRKQEQNDGTEFVTKIATRDLIKIGRLTDIMSIKKATKTVLLGKADPTDKTAFKAEIRSTKF